LVKTADATSDSEAGQQVVYSFLITNTGNVTVTDVTVQEDAFTGSGPLGSAICPTGAASLAPMAQVTCTITYTVTQADIDEGSITNTATAVGTPAGADESVTSPPSTAIVLEPAAASVTLVKSADLTSIGTAGEVIHFSFTVTNTGNITLFAPTVEEGEFTGVGTLPTPVCPEDADQLNPGEVVVCTADYTVVAGDLTGPALSNTATVTASAPNGDPIESTASTVTVAKVISPAPPTGLAWTGSAIAWGAGLFALGLIAAGGTFLLLVRRRRGVA
jgi:hypothetical protein